MDSLKPAQIVEELIYMGNYKSKLPLKDLLLRGFLSGAYLGFSTVLAFTVAIQSQQYYLGALAFPVGFVMIVLLGLELVTGNFATVPMAVMDKKTGIKDLLYNWAAAFTGNLIGSLAFGFLFFIYITKCGHTYDSDIIHKVIDVAKSKTLDYKDLGGIGLVTLVTKAILCNWMVTLGVVMGVVSSSTIGKIAAIWLPIFTFFALGLEHCVVNMFVIPSAMLLNAPINITDWLFWNQIPATFGNIIGGFVFTGLFLYLTLKKKNTDEHAA